MKTRLFLNYYLDKNPDRQWELDRCLTHNLDNPLIDKTYVLTDVSANTLPGVLSATEVVKFEGRPLFSDFFRVANEYAAAGDVTIIANTDIYFNHTLQHIHDLEDEECYALSRWDDTPGGLKPFHYWDSQDAWIFRGKIKPVYGDFSMGIPGCDNRLAYELKKAGYTVSNPCQTIYAMHVHNSAIRHYTSTTTAIPKPYVLVSPTQIGYPSSLHKVE
jgi:hypothetical protein